VHYGRNVLLVRLRNQNNNAKATLGPAFKLSSAQEICSEGPLNSHQTADN
jgi:hypothetical protein